MTDEELCKRLRDLGDHAAFEPHMHHVAADRIEALLNLNEALVELMDDRDAKLAKVLQAAEPLAAMADHYDPEDDDGHLECWSGLAVPKIKHIRALRAAIADIKIECQE